jgi:BON domain
MRTVKDAQRREDAKLRAGVLEALMLDTAVPESVDVKVEDGFLTLTGTAKWKYQRDAAQVVAERVVGARNVVDEIELVQPASPDVSDVKERIARALGGRGAAESDQFRIDVGRQGHDQRQRAVVVTARRRDRRSLGDLGSQRAGRPNHGRPVRP